MGGWTVISDERLNEFRLKGTRIRVVRDADPMNDVLGIVVAWNDTHVLVRKQNRRVLKLSREYLYQPADEERMPPDI